MRKPRYVVATDGSDKELVSRLRQSVVDKYGGKCYQCGESNVEVLEVFPQRKGGQKVTLYYLRAHAYPASVESVDVHLLCGNCQVRLRNGV